MCQEANQDQCQWENMILMLKIDGDKFGSIFLGFFPTIASCIPGTFFMISVTEWCFTDAYLASEWFFFGKISVPCALTCTILAKEVQSSFLGLGIYSGIFAIYLQCPSKESRTAIIVFYVNPLYSTWRRQRTSLSSPR
jgi:hypothetical protein